MNAIDQVFSVSPDVLAIRSQRTQLIAANLANADTPNYKAMDIDFGEALAMASGDLQSGGLRRTDADHMGVPGGDSLSSQVLYRMPSQPSLDGNTVETNREHVAFMDNAIRYQASLNFLDGKIRSLLLALKGE